MNHGRESVYLAGPMKGLSFAEARGWRLRATEVLQRAGLCALDPMRQYPHLADALCLDDVARDHPLTTPRACIDRDRLDVQRCAVVLLNLVGARRVSLGSVVEVGWADAYRKPIVLVIDEGNPHQHAFITDLATCITSSLDEGIGLVLGLVGAEMEARR